jgi:hypothetical protein
MHKSLNKILEKAGVQIKKTSALQRERNYFQNIINCLEELYAYRYQNKGTQFNREITGIVFSKNRAMQLHALLSSYFYYTISPAALKVLYTTDSEDHADSYKILMSDFALQPVEFIKEDSFKKQLLAVVGQIKSDRIFFMTDDAIFVEDYNLSDVLNFNPLEEIFSLRLGKDLKFSFAYNKEQILPDFKNEIINNQYFYKWTWGDMKSSPDWVYPLSLDGTVFSSSEINIMLKYIGFKNPNSLEANLQLFNNAFIVRNGVCYEKAKYVNIPCNIIQNEFENIYTGTYTISELVNLFLAGKRINWQAYKGMDSKIVQFSKYDFI